VPAQTSYRFLLTRRWLGLLLVVVLVALACYELGRWQFHRYDERHDRNVTTRANEQAAPVPIDQLMSTSSGPDESDEWRRVEARGTYDSDHQLVVSYRTREGTHGVDVLTPLVTSSGAAVLVDRGWIQTTGNGNVEVDTPDPPSGTVTVIGWVRRDSGDGGNRVEPADGAVRAISSAAIDDTVPYDLYVGFLDRRSEDPAVEPSPAVADPPDLSGGPSFFYGIQWWFFGVLALVFYGYFAYAERHQPRPATTRPDQPDHSARV
jgi:cytochrome oxidase assembly protein ShyY1